MKMRGELKRVRQKVGRVAGTRDELRGDREKIMRVRHRITASLLCASSAVTSAHAGTFMPIVVDGAFGDWAGIPVLAADVSEGTPIDIADVQLANDATNLYLRVMFHTAVNPNTGPSLFLAFDTDNNVATGFNVYGLNVVGSEAAFQNDFPFEQRTGFNSGGLTAAATISPIDFGNPTATVTSQEYSIPRSIAYSSDNVAVFGSSFTLMLWTDGASADTSSGIPYVFAAVPEPASFVVTVGGAVGLFRRRR
jgi:hypothetical protein